MDCGSLDDPDNGDVTVAKTTLGSTANYNCSSMYQVVGNTTRICQANGNWSGDIPICTLKESQSSNLSDTNIIIGSVAAVMMALLVSALILVVIRIFRSKKRHTIQLPSHSLESMAYGLKR